MIEDVHQHQKVLIIMKKSNDMMDQFANVFRLEKLHRIVVEVARNHAGFGNKRGNSQSDVLQEFCRQNSIGEDVSSIRDNAEIERADELRKVGQGERNGCDVDVLFQ